MASVIFEAKNEKTGEVLKGTAKEIGRKIGVDPSAIHVMAKKGYKAHKTWAFAKEGQPYVILTKPIKKCEVCGKEFVQTQHSKVTCGMKCKKIRYKEVLAKREDEPAPPPPPKKSSTHESIVEIDRRAKEAGMTYGQYVMEMGL